MVDVPSYTVHEWREKIATEFDSKPEYLIPILQYIQGDVGYLPPESMMAAACSVGSVASHRHAAA